MNTAALVRRNTVFSFVSQGIRLAANILMFVGIARFYGILEFGQFTTAHTYMTLFFITADFGIDLQTVIQVARDKSNAKAMVEKLLPLKLVSSVGSMAAMLIVLMLIPVTNATRVLMAILSVGVVGNALLSFFLSALKGFEIFHYETRVSFIQNTGLLVVLVVLGIFHFPIAYVAAAFVLSRFWGLALVFRIVLHQVGARSLNLSFENWRNTVQESAPYGIFLVSGTLLFTIDTIFLSIFRGEHEVGIYQSVFKLVALALVVCDVVVSTLVPTFTRFHAEDHSKWKSAAGLLLKFLVFCGISIGICTFVFAEDILRIVYGRGDFLQGVLIFRIFALTIVLRYMGETFGLMLTTAQKQPTRMKIVVFNLLLNVGLNLFAVPKYGVTGAAIVSLITNASVGGLLMYHNGRDSLGASYFMNIKFIALICSTVPVVAVSACVHVPFLAAVPAVLALMALWGYVWFTASEKAMAAEMIRTYSVSGMSRLTVHH